MTRAPVAASVLVAAAVAAMIALGMWQLLVRLPEKEAQLRQLAANPSRPAIAFPARPDDTLLFRRATGTCLPPVVVRLAGAGAAGFRAIADCRTAAGSGMAVQLGTTRDPKATVAWRGGEVSGYLSHAPDARPLILTLFDHSPKRLLLIADTPAPGLARNTPPDLDDVPNNHLAYAVQWFLFAGIAAIIYAIALARRRAPR